mgnify:CR=1 FL=1
MGISLLNLSEMKWAIESYIDGKSKLDGATGRLWTDYSIERRYRIMEKKIININIKAFLEKFNEAYDFLYDNYDRVAGYTEALEAGDSFIESHLDFVKEFNNYRGDILSSDREVVAFMFALESMEVA